MALFLSGSQSIGLAVHLQDVDVMGKPVKQRADQLLRTEETDPLSSNGKFDVTSMAPAKDFGQQFRTYHRERHIAQFIDSQ